MVNLLDPLGIQEILKNPKHPHYSILNKINNWLKKILNLEEKQKTYLPE